MARGRTILVVDDDAVFRGKILKPQLEGRGHRVVEASRIAEARKLLEQERPDMLIVDGLLPDGNGIDFVTALRGEGVELPILFVSAFWKDMDTHRRLTALGRVEVLRKPVNAENLHGRIAALTEPPEIEVEIDLDLD